MLRIQAALIGLVGSSDKEELKAMIATTQTFISTGSVPYKDGMAMINAAELLIDIEESASCANGQHSNNGVERTLPPQTIGCPPYKVNGWCFLTSTGRNCGDAPCIIDFANSKQP
jgi:hypothetical protein